MALLPSGLSQFGFRFDNWGTNPAATPGGTVTAGGSANTESATPLVLATGAQLTEDTCGIELSISDSSGTGDRQMLFDIGVDPAGGTSYTYVISNVVCGNTPVITTTGSGGHKFFFPIFIPAGSQVAIRTQCSQASITAKVQAMFFGRPGRPEAMPCGQFSETIGTITNSNGVSFTPGNAADGTWVDLGATAKDMWWWQLAYSVSNATITAEYTYIELAVGDATNKHIIHRAMHGGTTAEVAGMVLTTNRSPWASYWPTPAGAHLYVRGRCLNAPDTGYNAVAIGIGG